MNKMYGLFLNTYDLYVCGYYTDHFEQEFKCISTDPSKLVDYYIRTAGVKPYPIYEYGSAEQVAANHNTKAHYVIKEVEVV